MSLHKATGRIDFIGPKKQITDKFKKIEFAIETTGEAYPQFLKFEVKNDKADVFQPDDHEGPYSLGDTVTVEYYVRGKKHEKNGETMYFNSLDAWKIELGEGQQPQPKQAAPTASKPTAKDAAKSNQADKEKSAPAQQESFSDEDDGLPF